MPNRRYTQSEINTIIRLVEQNPSNLTCAFEVASNHLGRSPKAIEQKYYGYIKHNYTTVAVASPKQVVKGKNSIRRNVVPDATSVRDAMLHAAFSRLSKEQAIKYITKYLPEDTKISLLTRIVSRVTGE